MQRFIKRNTCTLILLLLGHSLSVLGQISKPVKPGNITYDLSRDGKIETPPPGFALIKGKSYDFKVSIAPDEKSQKQLLVYFRDKLLKTYKKLSDTNSPSAAFYKKLFGTEFESYKSELNELVTILRNPNAEQLLDRKNEGLKYFGTAATLKELLFTKALVANINKEEPVKGPSTAQIALTTKIEDTKGISFESMVRIRDMEKNFITAYYNKFRNDNTLNSMLNTINSESYYSSSLRYRYKGIKDTLQLVYNSLNPKMAYVCDENILALYNKMVIANTEMKGSQIFRVIQSDWMKYFVWMNEGEIRINPFNFTDENLLPFKKAYISAKATERDIYIQSAINLMIKSGDLNAQKTSVKLFDSLQNEQGKGTEKFGFKIDNELLKAENAKRAKNFLEANIPISKTTFRLVEPDRVDNYLLQVYHADNAQIVRDGKFFKGSYSNEMNFEAMVYNLKNDQSFKIKATTAPHSGESRVINGLKKVGGLGTELSPLMIASAGILGKLTPAPMKDANAVRNFDYITKAKEKIQSDLKMIEDSGPAKEWNKGPVNVAEKKRPEHKIYLKIEEKTKGRLFIVTYKGVLSINEWDLMKEADNWLLANGIQDCANLKNKLYGKIYTAFKDFKTKEFDHSHLNDVLPAVKAIQGNINVLINQVAKTWEYRRTATVYNNLTNMIADHDQLALILKDDDISLPPDELALVNSSEDPHYRNEFFNLTDEDSPKTRTIAASLMNAKGVVTDSLTDKFVTSSPDWVTGSLGIAYVFNGFRRSDAIVTGNVLTNVADEEQIRLIAGLHFYPWPILLSDDRFITQMKWKEIPHRLGFFLGFSFPKAFSNPHIGASVDLWAGIKLTGGVHFYRYTGYQILNDQIVDQHTRYRYSGAFMSLNIEPVTFAKLIGIFK